MRQASGTKIQGERRSISWASTWVDDKFSGQESYGIGAKERVDEFCRASLSDNKGLTPAQEWFSDRYQLLVANRCRQVSKSLPIWDQWSKDSKDCDLIIPINIKGMKLRKRLLVCRLLVACHSLSQAFYQVAALASIFYTAVIHLTSCWSAFCVNVLCINCHHLCVYYCSSDYLIFHVLQQLVSLTYTISIYCFIPCVIPCGLHLLNTSPINDWLSKKILFVLRILYLKKPPM